MPESKAKKTPPPVPADIFQEIKSYFERGMRRFFGMTQHWQKFRDIVQNNYELGLMHFKQDHISDAILRFKLVTWLEPAHASAWYYLGCSYLADGKKAQARTAFARSLQLKPGNEEAIYMMVLAGGRVTAVPKKMPLSLVRDHFDRHAADYNQEQLEAFQYEGHMLICNAIRASLVPGRIDHMMLELGVGTGLCGPLLRDVAAQLIGVDMSNSMLAEAVKQKDANGKQIYDALIKRELHEFLQQSANASYDVVLASNVLSYVGDAQAVFQQVARVLKPGGIFALTVDKMDGDGFQLDPTAARFRFSDSYLRQLASAHQLKEKMLESAILYPAYDAWLCVFTKP